MPNWGQFFGKFRLEGRRVVSLMINTTSDLAFDADFQTLPWLTWRKHMPVATKWAYFDHAAVGPLTRPAADAIRNYAQQAETDGDMHWPQWAAHLEGLRKSVARLIHAENDEVCLIPNTSTGINLVAEGFPWKAGDSVVVPEGEFPSNLYPWQNQQSRGVQLRVVPRQGNRVEVQDLLDHVDPSTRIIAVSWVGYASGFRVDLDELVRRAHERDVLVFVDAIQGLGIYEIDLRHTDVDFLAADGHKWMLGPEGMGAAMIRRRHLETLRCGNVGWNSVQNSFNYSDPQMQLRNSAVRFEPGSPNMPGAAALRASLDVFHAVRDHHGGHAIEDRILDLAGELDDRLKAAGFPTRTPAERKHRSGIVTFEVPGQDPAKVRSHLIESGCVVSCRGGGVRVAVHAYNNADDIDRLMRALSFYSN